MRIGISNIHNTFKDRIQFVLCGYDLRGTITEINKKTNEKRSRPIKPEETVWFKYEKIFTNDYSVLDNEYTAFLKMFKELDYNDSDKPYVRRWTKEINKYATNYNYFDVSLTPLVPNTFNGNKCIVGDFLISTTHGFKHISDIVDNKLNIKTEINGDINNVLNYFKYDDVDTIKIITNDGYEIEGTPSHKIFIDDNWSELKDLKIGDEIELTKPEFCKKNTKNLFIQCY